MILRGKVINRYRFIDELDIGVSRKKLIRRKMSKKYNKMDCIKREVEYI